MALEDFVLLLHVFLSNRGLELGKHPDFFHGNKLDNGVQHTGIL